MRRGREGALRWLWLVAETGCTGLLPGDSVPEPLVERCPEPDPALAPAYEDGPPPRSPAEGLWAYQRPVDPELRALASIGYVDGTELAVTEAGVVVSEPAATDGYGLYTSGHDAVAILLDLDGRELHRWWRPFDTLWPDRLVDDRRSEHQYWRRAALLPNGDLLAIIEGQGIVRLDWTSEVVWKWGGGAHHDLEVLPDERIWVLSRRAGYRPDLGVRPILEDFVTRLDPGGCPEVRISVLDAVLASGAREGFWRDGDWGDVFHTNSLRVLDETTARAHHAWRPGHLLLSLREPSGLVVLDPERAEIVWWWQGPFREQHDPRVVDDGLLMVFDNIGLGDDHSAVRAFDLDDGSEVWRVDEARGATLDSRYLGAAHRIGDGHLLVTESTQGHAFELDQHGEVVWAFRNPERAGPNDAYVAVLPEMLRIPLGYLQRPPGRPLIGDRPLLRR